MIKVTERTVNIPEILRSKMGDKAKYVPKFLVQWLQKLIHEDEINDFLWKNKDIVGLPWVEACKVFLDINDELRGIENLPHPDDGKRYTFVSNHPLGGIDGVELAEVLGKRYNGNIRIIVNDLLMNLPGLAPLCIPINTVGKKDRSLSKTINEGYNSEHHVFVFPAGLCSRRINGEIHDLPWTKSFIAKSVETHRDIVPIHFSGQNSPRFYRIANICAALKLKVNIAMLLLPDEMFKSRGKKVVITFGKPIPWQTFDKSKTTKEWAQWMQEQTYALAK